MSQQTNTINLHPTQNYLLIRPTEEPGTSKGGIIIPETARNARAITTGTIEEVGEDCTQEWCPGQMVLFPQHCEYRVSFGAEKGQMFFVRETDVIAASTVSRSYPPSLL